MIAQPIRIDDQEVGWLVRKPDGTYVAYSRVDNERFAFAGRDTAMQWLNAVWKVYDDKRRGRW